MCDVTRGSWYGRSGCSAFPMSRIRGSISTASTCVAPFFSAIATSDPEPAPMISTFFGVLPTLARSYGSPYCDSHCSRASAGIACWCGTPFTVIVTSGTPS